jgi:endonuclease YncB( thermonuclease family)
VVVYQTAVADSFGDYGLKDQSGKKWALLVADVTNLGAAGPIDLRSFGVGTGEGKSGYFAPRSTAAVMKKLTLGDTTDVQIKENSTVRVALAFDVPVSGKGVLTSNWYLALDGQELPLKGTATDAIESKSLPKLVPAMELEMGTIESVNGNGSFTFAPQNGAARPVSMSAVTTPPADKCYGAESAQAVMSITGGQVWLEKDEGTSSYLVWANDAQRGTFVLLNQALVEQGAAGARDGNSIYRPWLESLSSREEQKKNGLWATCRDTVGAYINPPTPTAEEVRAQYQQVDVRDFTIRTDDFTGKKIVVAGSVFNIQVQGGYTGMQIWATTVDGAQEAIVVQYRGDSSGIYEGTWVTVYGVGAGRFEGINGFGAPISQPLIKADMIDH